ncbi:hypothetical protein ACIBHX_30845 [Nonomuraea sp. NPDC050536]|uniref:hypothetical protein n=1 Tax=Nonomuraea sp. NPDC050536 TaxID=3364366 RepID=UPI0037C6F709
MLERSINPGGDSDETSAGHEAGSALEKDLESAVIKLDALLPLAQLEGGQLGALFDAALATLTEPTAGESATAYLTFRNLLPYATVDTGDRGGHGERADGTLRGNYDADALGDAIHVLEQDIEREWKTYPKRLEAVATSLAAGLKEDDGWSTDGRVRDAVAASARRLRAMARTMRAGGEHNAAQRINAARWDEHERLFRQT